MIEDADVDRFIEGLVSNIRTSKLFRQIVVVALEEIQEHVDAAMKATARATIEAIIGLVQTTESRIEIARELRKMRDAVEVVDPEPVPAGTSN